jgi:hypothetical protein
MIQILIIVLIVSFLNPKFRHHLENHLGNDSIGFAIFSILVGLWNRFWFFPLTVDLQETFKGASSKIQYELSLINLGFILSFFLLALGIYYKAHNGPKSFFYPIYILIILSLAVTIWAAVTVMIASSADSLFR